MRHFRCRVVECRGASSLCKALCSKHLTETYKGMIKNPKVVKVVLYLIVIGILYEIFIRLYFPLYFNWSGAGAKIIESMVEKGYFDGVSLDEIISPLENVLNKLALLFYFAVFLYGAFTLFYIRKHFCILILINATIVLYEILRLSFFTQDGLFGNYYMMYLGMTYSGLYFTYLWSDLIYPLISIGSLAYVVRRLLNKKSLKLAI